MTRRGAFTLIEVLVTVAIIALLIGIAAPSISEARRISKKGQCQHNLHQIGVGVQAYLQVNREIFPYIARMPSIEKKVAELDGNRNPFIPISKAFAREFGNRSKVLECPADEVTRLAESEMALILAAGSRLRMGARYYDSEDTSYEWTTEVNGLYRHVKYLKLFQNMVNVPLRRVWIVNDFDTFHGSPTRIGSVNYLYADLHVSDRSDF